MLFLQGCALRMFHVIEGQTTSDQITSEGRSKNAREQIAFFKFQSILVEVETKLQYGYIRAVQA